MTDDDPQIIIPRSVLANLYDLAVGSMDFGSGFWDLEDVTAARAAAQALGVDPSEATPSEYRRNFPHKHIPRVREQPWRSASVNIHTLEVRWTDIQPTVDLTCQVCGQAEEYVIHHVPLQET